MTLRSFVLVAGLVALPSLAMAQAGAPVDPRWTPWLGCWDLRTENLTEGDVDPAVAAARLALPNSRARGVSICVTPTASSAEIRQQTLAEDQILLEETVAADGVERPVQDQNCRGTRAAEWSSTGRQLFTRGTLTCDGQPKRTISGTTFMVPGPTWVDVQLVEVNGQRSVRIRRYGPSRDQTRVQGQSAAASVVRQSSLVERFAIEEVKEASRKAAPEVVQAALVEVGAKFPLNRQRLIELDDAGVPGPVVDVMMALSFPERFVLERASSSSGGGGGGGWYDPWAISSPLAFLSLYAPFGYQYYGYYDPSWISGPGSGWIIVDPGPVQPAGPEGRVVNGLGYTRVTPREPAPRTSDGTGGYGVTVDRSGDGGSSGSSGGTATSGGYSSGGGGSTGRTAQPRPPGGQ